MPLPRYDFRQVQRPSGLVPPTAALDGVTELRVHGVGGTTPASLLGDDAPLQVSGDRIAGFYRTADVKGRHVEAYSWGGLTSRSGFRALWVLLLPFALVNLAGWMCAPRVHGQPWLFWLHRTTVRLAAVAQTINVVAIAVLMFIDVTAYQCGGQDACTDGRWWLAPLRDPWVVDHPGRRVVLGTLPVLLIIALLGLLMRNSLNRYEAVEPPFRLTAQPPRSAVGAAARGRGLADRAFWDGERTTRRLGGLHIAMTLAFLALVVVHVAATTTLAAGAVGSLAGLRASVLVASGFVLAASAALLVVDVPSSRAESWRSGDRLAQLVLYVAGVTLLAGFVYAWMQPAWTPDVVGPLHGIRNLSRYTWMAVLGATGLVAVPTLLAGRVAGSFRGGPVVVAALGSLILNLVGLAALLSYAVFVSPVSYGAPEATAGAAVYVSSVIGTTLPRLAGLIVASLVAFALVEWLVYLRAGRESERDKIRDEYNKMAKPATTQREWSYSILDWAQIGIDQEDGSKSAKRWLQRIAHARRAARTPHDIDLLLILLVVVGVVAATSAWLGTQVPSPNGLAVLGSRIVTLTPLLVLAVVRNSWSSVEKRRRVGILWDVGTFWPRAYHPLAPPCYAERAVPELQRRLWRLHDSGGRVVVAAHSQGAVLSAASLLQADQLPPDARVALATFGAPLRTLYQWAFPHYFRDDFLAGLSTSTKNVVTWRNYYYKTDYIGGAALSKQPNPIDEDLNDPPTSWLVYGQPPPPVGTHSGYWTDPVMWAGIDKLAMCVAPHDPLPAGLHVRSS